MPRPTKRKTAHKKVSRDERANLLEINSILSIQKQAHRHCRNDRKFRSRLYSFTANWTLLGSSQTIRKTWRYMGLYRHGITGKLAEYALKNIYRTEESPKMHGMNYEQINSSTFLNRRFKISMCCSICNININVEFYFSTPHWIFIVYTYDWTLKVYLRQKSIKKTY